MEENVRGWLDEYDRSRSSAPSVAAKQTKSGAPHAVEIKSDEKGTNWGRFFDALFKGKPEKPHLGIGSVRG